MTRTLANEFETATTTKSRGTSTVSTSIKGAWICEMSSFDLLEEDKKQIDRLININDYVATPFLEDDIKPYEWNQTLSTLDVCALPPPTQFCNEEGYEIVPVRMILVVKDESNRIIDSKVKSALKL